MDEYEWFIAAHVGFEKAGDVCTKQKNINFLRGEIPYRANQSLRQSLYSSSLMFVTLIIALARCGSPINSGQCERRYRYMTGAFVHPFLAHALLYPPPPHLQIILSQCHVNGT